MIISRMSGGIGNQLFQYAFGRALAIKNGTELKLDVHAFGEEKHRRFELSNFDIKAVIARDEDYKAIRVPNPTKSGWVAGAIRKLFRAYESVKPLCKRRFVIEPGFTFVPELMDAGPDAYLSGVWQSEKYFSPVAEEIRKDLSLRERPSTSFLGSLEKALSTDSVSVHIRRGDYVSNPKANALHGVCGADYYERAVDLIKSRLKDPVFFIFSDDIVWAKENVKIGESDAVYVSGTGLSDAEELVLMSRCKHNVIANSTWSWWGAWLNDNPQKTVIAPKQWFQASHLDTKDLIPSEWLRL